VSIGHLDAPLDGAIVERGVLRVSGWTIFPSGPTSRIEVLFGDRSLGLAQLGIARPDVAALHGPGGAVSGFSLVTDLAERSDLGGAIEVRALATSVAGERLELGPATVELVSAPAAAADVPSERRPARRGRGRRVLACTHQLCLGGASRQLFELLDELLRQEAVDPVVFSPIDGPLRPMLESLGIPVHVTGDVPLGDATALEDRVEEVLAWVAPQDFELAIVNTASALNVCGTEVASRLGIPAAWLIHESFQLAVLWEGCSAQVRERLERVLGEAALAIFEADATRHLYEPLLSGRCHTVPYGIDLETIDAVRSGFDRAAARQRLGIPPEAELILCVGSVEPRKAQAVLAQAFDLLSARHPRAQLALVGAGDSADVQALAEWIAASSSAGRIDLVPTTPEIQPWYGVSDLLVCASRIESLPRAVVEGMAWELPVLATAVFGLPELIEDGATGWLCEPGDTAALAAALDRALDSSAEERRRIGRAGRALVERRHALAPYGTEIARLLEGALGGSLSGVASSPADAGAPAPDSRRG